MKLFSSQKQYTLTITIFSLLMSVQLSLATATEAKLIHNAGPKNLASRNSAIVGQLPPCDERLGVAVQGFVSPCNGAANGEIVGVTIASNVGTFPLLWYLTSQTIPNPPTLIREVLASGGNVTNIPGDTYSVEIVSADQHCESQAQLILPNINNPLTVNIIVNCSGDAFITGQTGGGATVTVTVVGQPTQTLTVGDSGLFNIVFPALANGTYQGSVSSNLDGCITTQNISFLVNNLTFATLPINSCNGQNNGEIRVTLTPPQEGKSPYTIYVDNFQVPAGTFTGPTTTLTGLSATLPNGQPAYHAVYITDSNIPALCGQQNNIVFSNDELSLFISSWFTDCFGNLNVTIANPNFLVTLSAGNQTVQTFARPSTTGVGAYNATFPQPFEPGPYTLSVTSENPANPGCNKLVTTQLSLPTNKPLGVNVTTTDACNGINNGSITVALQLPTLATNPVNVFLNGTLVQSFNTPPFETTIFGLAHGSYAVTVSDSAVGGPLCFTQEVAIRTDQFAVSITGVTGSVCVGIPVTLTAVPVNGTPISFRWQDQTGTVVSNSASFMPSTATAGTNTYTVFVTDTNGCSASASQTVTVTPCARLSLTKFVINGTMPATGTGTFTVNVSNTGNANATNVTVTDILPPQFTFQSAAGSGWTVTNTGQNVTAVLPTLPAGTEASLSVTVTTTACTDQFIANTASLVSDQTPTPEVATFVVHMV